MMKTKLLIALLITFGSYAIAQEKKESPKPEKQVNVPELVKKEFAAKYPKATKVKWGIEKPGEYEAEFDLNKSEMSVVIDEKGNVLEVETEMKEAELPQAVKATIAKDFAGYKIGEVEKSDAKGVVSYEMEAKKDKAEFELVFNGNGKLLKKEEKKEEKDND
ncbi:MAG: hypothetical protein LWX56_03870 [Ignavibacteria bacterium]|nr:hypothetical protein [Ignavibacteria bacterium]